LLSDTIRALLRDTIRALLRGSRFRVRPQPLRWQGVNPPHRCS